MSDPMRTDPLPAARAETEPDRDAKIEQLLLAGLDHYFASEFEQAINIWTRALFLDRSHARARAYIERARSALAERQRESEELLQNGLAAFRRGHGDEARRLLEAAMNHGAPREEALAVLDRLSRLEPAAATSSLLNEPRASQPPNPAVASDSSRRRLALAIAIVAGAVAISGIVLFVSAAYPSWQSLLAPERASVQSPPVPITVDSLLPIPMRGETALVRARSLAASGHLHDALSALDAVKSTDAQKADADHLRATIQKQLIGLVTKPAPAASRNGATPLP